MKVLVLGSGGREHAICWKLANSASIDRVFCMPGNPGIKECAQLVHGDPANIAQGLEVCDDLRPDLVVIGPEKPLIVGVADALRTAGTQVYGPSKSCARLEGSKAFAKKLMDEEGIPTAAFRSFTDFGKARAYIEEKFPVAVKASGEALGKGAVIPNTLEEAIDAAERMLVKGELGDAGKEVVIEARLFGRELSLMAVCSGADYRVLPSAQDYKAAFDGGEGSNTGGMGAISPAPEITQQQLEEYGRTFVAPVLRRFEREGTPFVGTLYPGLMLTKDGPRALEYNVRFGDPETQAILPRLRSDFGDLLYKAASGGVLPKISAAEDVCVAVVVASNGYPSEYRKGVRLPELPTGPDFLVFQAGTAIESGSLVSAGGRVLNIVGTGSDSAAAREAAYRAAASFQSGDWHFRNDIGA